MKNYTLKSCENLIEKYMNFGGYIEQIEEGSLGLGFLILYGAPGKKSIIIQEYFINPWQSGHNVTMYNKLPKKYQNLLTHN
jgi:hypothetical protein